MYRQAARVPKGNGTDNSKRSEKNTRAGARHSQKTKNIIAKNLSTTSVTAEGGTTRAEQRHSWQRSIYLRMLIGRTNQSINS